MSVPLHASARTTAALQYLLGVWFPSDSHRLIESGSVLYCKEDDVGVDRRCVAIIHSGFFGNQYLSPSSLPEEAVGELHHVPMFFGHPTVSRRGMAIVVYADVIASAFLFLSRYEEVVRPTARDDHGRFLGRDSLAFRQGIVHRPIVDEYRELMRGWLDSAGVTLAEDKSCFSVCLTHDIDRLRRFGPLWRIDRTLRSGRGIRGRVGDACNHLLVAGGLRRDPFDNLNDVIELDRRIWHEHFPAVQTPIFFFQTGAPEDETAGYALWEPMVRRAIKDVRAGGVRVGLHASLAASRFPERLSNERRLISEACGEEVSMNRHHYLALRESADQFELARAGIRHDYTLGFADIAGFRLGTCRPFPLFDPASFSYCGVTEHPLVVMDCTLVWSRYMGLGDNEALDYCMHLARAVARHQGELVLLWHNTELAPGSRTRALYVRVLRELSTLIEQRDGSSPNGVL